MPLGVFVVISTLAIGLGVHILNVWRDAEYRQALRDWAALKDPFGMACWRKHAWRMVQPIAVAFAWMVLWALIIEVLKWIHA